MDAFEFEFEYKPWLVVLPVAEAIFCCILNIVPKKKKEEKKQMTPGTFFCVFFFLSSRFFFFRYFQIVQSGDILAHCEKQVGHWSGGHVENFEH